MPRKVKRKTYYPRKKSRNGIGNILSILTVHSKLIIKITLKRRRNSMALDLVVTLELCRILLVGVPVPKPNTISRRLPANARWRTNGNCNLNCLLHDDSKDSESILQLSRLLFSWTDERNYLEEFWRYIST